MTDWFRKLLEELDSIDESGELWELAKEICAQPPSTETREEWAKRLAHEMVEFGMKHDGTVSSNGGSKDE